MRTKLDEQRSERVLGLFLERDAASRDRSSIGGDYLRAQKPSRASLAGQDKRAKFPTSKALISAVFHSFRLIFGRAIISRNGLEAWMFFSVTHARGTLTLKRR